MSQTHIMPLTRLTSIMGVEFWDLLYPSTASERLLIGTYAVWILATVKRRAPRSVRIDKSNPPSDLAIQRGQWRFVFTVD